MKVINIKTYFCELKHNALAYFCWYRKKCGGIWYQYMERDGRFYGSFWTQTKRQQDISIQHTIFLEEIEDYGESKRNGG